MHTLSADDVTRQPKLLLDDVAQGQAALVTRDGAPCRWPLESNASWIVSLPPLVLELAVASTGPLILLRRADWLDLLGWLGVLVRPLGAKPRRTTQSGKLTSCATESDARLQP